jgi:formate hydrogenlyase transcriptional activator
MGSENAMPRERELGSAVFSTSSALVIVLDREGQIVRFNRACEKLTGFTFAELRGELFWDHLLIPEEIEPVKAVFAELRAGQFPNEHQNYWVTKRGARRLIMWSNTALVDERGAVEHVIGTGIDVTERWEAQAALKESERKYRQVVESLHEGIWLIDEAGHTCFTNNRMAEMLGYTAQEMAGRHLFSFMDERGKKICENNLARRKQGIEEDHEFELLRKDGTRVYTLMSTSPVRDEDGNYSGAIAGVLDITARKRAEKALQQAHAELERRVEERTGELRRALEEVARLKDRLESENLYLREEIRSTHGYEEIIGESLTLREVLYKVEQVASTDASVLLLGETGTGKELIAHAIHKGSPRSGEPLVKVNCAALPGTLIESELFGHEKGAFTGAHSTRAGRFELADGGTLFLDEISDIPLELQAKLLRILQDGRFEKLGATVTQEVNVRVITACNCNLEEAVARGAFRSDLYYRLGVFPIEIPPLRERREDIPLLVWHFINKKQSNLGRSIERVPADVMEALQAYVWPGNVRELENVIERALILSAGGTLSLDESFSSAAPAHAAIPASSSLRDVERAHILKVVEDCRWRVKGKNNAAERLGINPSTLRDRMKRLGIVRRT